MLGAIIGIGAGIAKGIMGNQAKKDQFEENKQLMEHQAELINNKRFIPQDWQGIYGIIPITKTL